MRTMTVINLKMATDFVLIQRTKFFPPTFLETTLCDKMYAKIVDHIELNWLRYALDSVPKLPKCIGHKYGFWQSNLFLIED